ncbi:reverse transcriptase domain-containing protein [Tanacetum coccineum]
MPPATAATEAESGGHPFPEAAEGVGGEEGLPRIHMKSGFVPEWLLGFCGGGIVVGVLLSKKDEVRKMVDSGVKAVGIGMGRRRQRSRRGLPEHQESSGGQHSSFLADLCINKLASSVRHDFDGIEDVSDDEVQDDVKGKEKVGHRMPTNVRIYDGTSDPEDHMGRFVGIGGEWTMPVWCRMFQQTLDGKARAWFDKLPPDNINNWGSLQEKFLNRFRMLKACDKNPTKISNIARRDIWKTLPHFQREVGKRVNAIPNVRS